MSTAMLVPLATGNRTLTIALFLAVVAVTLYITFWASRQSKTAADYYAGGRSFSGFQNGLAVSGDYMSAASFLGISGAIALYGYDGFLYSIGFLVAWLVALLLIAELLRNSGQVHHGRPAGIPDAPDASPDRGGHVDDRCLDLLPAGPDGRRRSPRGSAPRGHQPGSEERRDRPGRRADDHLRHFWRDEGHHLGTDRQGCDADGSAPW